MYVFSVRGAIQRLLVLLRAQMDLVSTHARAQAQILHLGASARKDCNSGRIAKPKLAMQPFLSALQVGA